MRVCFPLIIHLVSIILQAETYNRVINEKKIYENMALRIMKFLGVDGHCPIVCKWSVVLEIKKKVITDYSPVCGFNSQDFQW